MEQENEITSTYVPSAINVMDIVFARLLEILGQLTSRMTRPIFYY